jgi:hypothetical protein
MAPGWIASPAASWLVSEEIVCISLKDALEPPSGGRIIMACQNDSE